MLAYDKLRNTLLSQQKRGALTRAESDLLVLTSSPDCEFFRFGELDLESAQPINDMPAWRVPQLTEEEWGFWGEGLIPLPSPIVLYEFAVAGITSGLVVVRRDNGDGWCNRIEYVQGGYVDDVWTKVAEEAEIAARSDLMSAKIQKAYKEDPANVSAIYGSNGVLAAYLTLMISSKSTEVQPVMPTLAQVRLRRQLGRTITPYRQVTIIPGHIMRRAHDEAESSGRKSPRIHWRRSHVRTIYPGTSEEKRLVIPRFIVGRRDLSEETVHREYVVKGVKCSQT